MASKKYSKETILRAAYEIALESGLKKISMRKLADRIGCSVMPIYEAFDSKEELISAIAVFSETMDDYDQITLYDRYIRIFQYGMKYPKFYLDINEHISEHLNLQKIQCQMCFLLQKDERLKKRTDREVLAISSRIEVFVTGIIFSYQHVPYDTRMEATGRVQKVLTEVIDSIIDGYLKTH